MGIPRSSLQGLSRCLGLAACSLLLVRGRASAEIPSDYYDAADTSSAAALRSSLNDIISAGHSGISFASTFLSFDAMERIDRDDGDSSRVRLIYSHDTRVIEPNANASDGDPTTGDWNREDIFPRTFFDSAEPSGGDFHNLFPADVDLNITRGTKSFEDVTTPTYTDVFGSRADASLFEPPDSMKGDVARALFYMDVRYEGEGSEPDLDLIDAAPGGSGQNEMAYLATLLQWHNDDPPDAFEVERNERVYAEQGNANPFVDHPEWVNIVYGSSSPSVTNGNSIAVSATDLAPANILQGEANVAVLSLDLTLGADEYDVGEIDVQKLGTVSDSGVDRVKLWRDADASGSVTAGDMLLDSEPLASGAATLAPYAPLRLEPGTTRILFTLSMKPTATLGATAGLRVLANGLRHDSRGGVDNNPVFGNTDSSLPTIQDGPDSPYQKLIISEVFEGTANNLKYVEIYNSSASSVDLDDSSHDIVLRRYTDGAASPSATIDLTGVIAAGDFFVVVNNNADFDAVFSSSLRDQTSGSINHNGNDYYDLRDSTGDELIDAFASDRAGSSAVFANDLVAFRRAGALPNGGDWGNSSRPADGANSASGNWKVTHITAGNGNAAAAGTPGSAGVGEVSVVLASFSVE